jgi:hypothetical protein
MNTPEKTKTEIEVLPEWYEPFHEPQTIPVGWDLSTVLSTVTPGTIDDPATQVED